MRVFLVRENSFEIHDKNFSRRRVIHRSCGEQILRALLASMNNSGIAISPAIYRWVKESEAISSPEGTEEPVSRHSFAPSGAWSVRDTSIPAINRWAIVDRPCGTGTAHVASNPSGIARPRAQKHYLL